MDNSLNTTINESSRPRLENIGESLLTEQIPNKYKLKLRYGGFLRLAKKSGRKRYCFGFQKSIYMDTCAYNLKQLIDEVMKHYLLKSNIILSILFVDKFALEQSFIELDSNENFIIMLSMYEKEKEVTIYVTEYNNIDTAIIQHSDQSEVTNDPREEEDSDYCPSEESYHSHFSDNEGEILNYEDETYSNSTKTPTMKLNSKFPNVVDFRRALRHHALINEFEYFIEKSDLTRLTARCTNIECKWRIHASRMQDGITFEVKRLVETHSCIRSNKGGNRCASQGWIADVVIDKLKSDGDVSPTELRKWLMKIYNVDVPYLKVFRGREQAYTNMYGKWDDSFMKMEDFKEELQNRNPGSIVEIGFETDGDKKRFQRFFISLVACSRGFVVGCRPYFGLDACHLKGKFTGVGMKIHVTNFQPPLSQ